ncbi:cytochrome ubiquinol oxidase subunit I [Ilumatobacter coccineus]|uniref:Cytochrome bd ubiquinol oxidase subunit I n=1 Tax=Ilumatobacter coccineus (strain NBRC 103263 / KCTC 29153 / YM16-304) TaxID=1313172 RepID=A0A6C7E482_ILUCY|nr:cytochrome ubiquinol oxidase subunit I [Ilumatobacter coccineus]BAN01727.1 cytochrome bd ubiquinol oxidase subunit I [Ilumatobacter coccineus YM16-304]
MLLAANELMAARYQMALSLGFHIILSCFGVALPALIYVLHRRGLKHDDHDALVLAKKWAKVSAVLFAVGAVSGTILSFEMGLLWPGLMSTYGDVIGLPFALEGIAFFLEAIFIGIYLYGWDRLPPRLHLNTLIPIIASGAFGTFCIIAVNAWMNNPAGFSIDPETGDVVDIDPLAAMFNNAVWGQAAHMFVATYAVTGFLVASVYAIGMLKGRRDRAHRLGFTVAMVFASIAAITQPAIGHFTGQRLAEDQPAKLAAFELSAEAEDRAPLTVGGLWIDGEKRFAIEIPWLGSIASGNSLNQVVPGLDDIPLDEQPPINVTHLAFQAMVAAGTAMAGIVAVYWWRRRRVGDAVFERRWLMWSVVAGGGLSVLALEAGWTATEVGRQPWIAYGVMRTEDAVTDNSGIWFSLVAMIVVYASMGALATRVIRGMTRRWRESDDVDLPTPYGPSRELESVGASTAAIDGGDGGDGGEA